MRAPHLTAIGSGKGGTGKTMISIGLAQALAQSGARVLLCDADLGLANAGVQMGLGDSGDLPSFLAGLKPLDRSVAATDAGFDILAAPSGSGALANAGALAAENLCARLRTAGGYDHVLLDLSAGVDAAVMRFAACADTTLLVVTPDPASLTDAYAFAKLLQKATGTRLPQLIINRAVSEAEAERTREAMAATCRAFLRQVPQLLGIVPHDPRVRDAVCRQLPVLARVPHGPAAKAVLALAGRLREVAQPFPMALAAAR
ncbi:MAG: AAA family ATPase [Alphaproteobacteria bacterium]|nr:AAA family ATPase [Alphaproteobacteria bacterium]